MSTITAPGRMAVSAALAGVAVIGLVTGCTKETTGTPAASPTTTGAGHLNEPLWNPCNSVSTEALQAAKLDPATKVTDMDVNGPVDTTTKACGWSSTEGPYQVGVGAQRFTLDQVRANTDLVGFRNVQVGSRAGVMADDKADAATDKLDCYVFVPFTQGALDINVYWRYSERDKVTQSPCDLALSHALALEPFLPK